MSFKPHGLDTKVRVKMSFNLRFHVLKVRAQTSLPSGGPLMILIM